MRNNGTRRCFFLSGYIHNPFHDPRGQAVRLPLVDTSQSRLLLVVINRSLVVHICMRRSGRLSGQRAPRDAAGMVDAHLV